MGNKLYIDKSCRICSTYATYINSNKSIKLDIKDINNSKNSLETKNQIVFEYNKKCFYGAEGIMKSLEVTKKHTVWYKILNLAPKFLVNYIYKLISENRYKISKLLSIIKPKS